MKKKLGIAAVILSLTATGTSAAKLGYQCNIKTTAEKVEFGPVKMFLQDGFIELRTPYGTEGNVQKVSGEVAHWVPADEENFLFNYAVDSETGETQFAINGEVICSAVFDASKGKTAINETWTRVTPVEGTVKRVTNPVNSITSIVSADTAGVSFNTAAPIVNASLKNFKITSSTGVNIPVVDYYKNIYTVTLKTKEAMTTGQKYTISGTAVDVYGVETAFSSEFTPSSDAELTVGGAPKLSDEEQRTLGFNFRANWYTEPRLTYDYSFPASKLTIGKDNAGNSYSDPTDAYFTALHAAEVSSDYVKEGRFSLKWDNHNVYPAISAVDVPPDWTGANEISFDIYSEKVTDETVTMIIYSDNLATKWRDGYSYSFKIDWTGWKEFKIPLSDFALLNNPTGFNNVKSINFTAKAFRADANPYTVLYLDNIRLGYNDKYPVTPSNSVRVTNEYAHRAPELNTDYFNHDFPEVYDSSDKSAPYQYAAYYLAERALNGYFPKYIPGAVSFDTTGKAYVRADTTHIQYKDDSGKWQMIDLEDVVRSYVGQLGDTRVWDGYDEKVIRFDTDGGAYVLIPAAGRIYLLYSNDGMKTWQCTELYQTVKDLLVDECKTYMFTCARFEHIDGGNTKATEKPPVILLHTGEGSEALGGYLLMPSKNASGGLDFKAVRYADSCICTSYHTGDGNTVVTSGDYAYIVYGDPNDATTETGLNGDLSYENNGHTYQYKYGVPTYIIKYNMSTGEMSKTFLGYAGAKSETADSDYLDRDAHNWSGVSIDNSGYIHVIMNGHHHPVCYTKSKKANDISSWEDIQQIGNGNIAVSGNSSKQSHLQQSYGAMIIDNNDNVYVITRDSSSKGYRFDTTVYVKTQIGLGFQGVTKYDAWVYTPIQRRLTPYYEVARQRISYNPTDDSIYVFYYAQSNYGQFFRDEVDAQVFADPEIERVWLKNSDGWPTGISEGSGGSYGIGSIDTLASGRDGVVVKASGVGKNYSELQIKNVEPPVFKLVETGDLK